MQIRHADPVEHPLAIRIIKQLKQKGCSLPKRIRLPSWIFSPSVGVLVQVFWQLMEFQKFNYNCPYSYSYVQNGNLLISLSDSAPTEWINVPQLAYCVKTSYTLKTCHFFIIPSFIIPHLLLMAMLFRDYYIGYVVSQTVIIKPWIGYVVVQPVLEMLSRYNGPNAGLEALHHPSRTRLISLNPGTSCGLVQKRY